MPNFAPYLRPTALRKSIFLLYLNIEVTSLPQVWYGIGIYIEFYHRL